MKHPTEKQFRPNVQPHPMLQKCYAQNDDVLDRPLISFKFSLSLEKKHTIVNLASINPLKIKDVETYCEEINEVEVMFWNLCISIF